MKDMQTERHLVFRETQHRFARYFLEFARQHRSDFEALDAEFGNILVAVELYLEQEHWQLLIELARTLGDYWVKRGLWDAYTRYNRILLSTGVLESNEKLKILGQLARVEEARGDYAEARSLYRQQLQIYDQSETKDRDVLIVALRELVKLATLQGDYDEAEHHLIRWLTVARDQQNAREQADILLELAALHQKKSELDKADSFCQQGFEIARRIGYQVGVVDVLRQVASIQRDKGDLQRAHQLCQAALDAALKMGDQVRASEIRDQLTALKVVMGKDVFISYSHRDRDFVERLARDLKAAGLAVWWDEWEIKVGDSIIQKVSEGIKQSAYLAAALSPHSVQSNWVQRELGSALMRQLSADRDITILPLMVSDCEVPVLLREIKWADFRQDYQAGLQELLDALIEDKG